MSLLVLVAPAAVVVVVVSATTLLPSLWCHARALITCFLSAQEVTALGWVGVIAFRLSAVTGYLKEQGLALDQRLLTRSFRLPTFSITHHFCDTNEHPQNAQKLAVRRRITRALELSMETIV